LRLRVEGVKDDPGFHAYFDAVEEYERRASARRRCQAVLREAADEVLGAGAEGVVFRVGERAAKVFDRWSESERAEHLPTLHAIPARPAPGALPRVLAVHDATEPVVEMERLVGEPYAGGRGPEVVALLRALHLAGWSHTNICPKNLLVTPDGLRLTDVGRSV